MATRIRRRSVLSTAHKRDAVRTVRKGMDRRNVGPMLGSLRCGAKTRAGTPCRSPAVAGKARCRMHGGARGSGAPSGNQNALKHGEYSRKWVEARRNVAELLRSARLTLGEIG